MKVNTSAVAFVKISIFVLILYGKGDETLEENEICHRIHSLFFQRPMRTNTPHFMCTCGIPCIP